MREIAEIRRGERDGVVERYLLASSDNLFPDTFDNICIHGCILRAVLLNVMHCRKPYTVFVLGSKLKDYIFMPDCGKYATRHLKSGLRD